MNYKEYAKKPIFFEKNRVFRVYLGGKLFSDFFGDDSEDSFYPEEWICSSTKALNDGSKDEFEGISKIKGADIYFNQLIEAEKELMLGDRDGLDVLVKALDSAIRLPVQAHPDKEFSRKHFNSEFGKAEAWLILATRPDAHIFFGFKDDITKEDLEKAVEDSEHDKDAMERLVNKFPVAPGDVYFIPAKAIHAIGKGCLILEIQEPTDFTIQPERLCGDYRLSDKQMYLDLDKETALSVFDYSYNKERVLKECRKTPTVISNENNCVKSVLISKEDTPCFSLHRYEISNGKTEKLSAPVIYVVTDGKGTLTNGDECIDIKKGDYFFMPYSCNKEYFVEASDKLTLAACIPPERI